MTRTQRTPSPPAPPPADHPTPARLDVPLVDLRPHPRNYNRHPARQVERIAASLRTFGQVRGIVVWRGTILAGHGVVEAARALGWPTLRADVLPDEYPEHLALAYVAADNELGRMADPDMEQLAAILEESRAADAGLLEAIGYDDAELDELLARLDRISQLDAEPQETEADRLAQEWQTAAGQLWQCGPHRIACGDCTDPATWQRVMAGEQADLLWTDPPYGVDYAAKNEIVNALIGSLGSKVVGTPIEDDATPEQAAETARAALSLAAQHSRPGAAFYLCAPPGPDLARSMQAVTAAGWDHRHTLAWVKNKIVPGRSDYNYQHEPILYGWKPGAGHTWHDISAPSSVQDDEPNPRRLNRAELIALVDQLRTERRSDVIRIPKPNRSEYHPTTKPAALIVATAKNNTAPGDLWIDPFGGSGSTLIAAQQIERRAYLIELSPGYVAVTLQRWQDATGDTPRLVEGLAHG